MIIFWVIYLVGYFLAFRQCKLNFLHIDDSWTVGDMIASLLLALGSWIMWVITASIYLKETDFENNKFKQWLEKDLKEKNNKE